MLATDQAVNCNWPLCVDFPGRRRCNVTVQPYLDEKFLNRVRRAYRAAIAVSGDAGQMWAPIDSRRNDVHSALLHQQNDALRTIFADPTATDLYYGCDNLCRSITQSSPRYSSKPRSRAAAAAMPPVRPNKWPPFLPKAASVQWSRSGPAWGERPSLRTALASSITARSICRLASRPRRASWQEAPGPDKLWFDGEASELATGKVKLFCAGKLPSGRFGVALNVDSMTEMPWHVAFGYARWLGQHADFFLSINHALNHFTVAELMAFAGMKCQARSAPFDPDGYVPGCFYREGLYALRPIRAANVRGGAFSLFLKGRRLYAAARRRVSIAAKIIVAGWRAR